MASLLVTQDDARSAAAVQRVREDGGHVTIRVIGPTTYFTADRGGFIKFFGLTASQAQQVRGLWVPLVPGEPGYTSVTEGVTLPSTLRRCSWPVG